MAALPTSRSKPIPHAAICSTSRSWASFGLAEKRWGRLPKQLSPPPSVKNWAQSLSLRCQSPVLEQQQPPQHQHLRLSLENLAGKLGFPLQMGWAPHDAACTVIVFAGSYLLVRVFDVLVQKDVIGQKLSRKLIHILSGILYALTWPIYSTSPWSRYIALAIPMANLLKLLFYGLGVLKDEGLVKSISREGTPGELLRGPLYYVLVLSFCTIFFWRDSPVGIIALAMMCGGDGIADIIGRRLGGAKLPYNSSKSWAGSIAMFIFGFALSVGLFYYYTSLGFYQLDWRVAIPNIALISLVATLVESLPISTWVDDNMSVPLASVILGAALFRPR